MVEDRFDDIGAAISNSETDVALDAIQMLIEGIAFPAHPTLETGC